MQVWGHPTSKHLTTPELDCHTFRLIVNRFTMIYKANPCFVVSRSSQHHSRVRLVLIGGWTNQFRMVIQTLLIYRISEPNNIWALPDQILLLDILSISS